MSKHNSQGSAQTAEAAGTHPTGDLFEIPKQTLLVFIRITTKIQKKIKLFLSS